MTPRRQRKIEELRKKGVYLLPNLVTTGNVFCGVFAIHAVLSKHYIGAAVMILAAAFFDLLDGKIARMTRTESHFGLEYDSLSDVISFGVAPGLLVYAWGLSIYGQLGGAALFLYIACGALRLARFNSYGVPSDIKGFIGLPIPAAAVLIATLILLDDYILHFGQELRPMVILGITYALSFLMVSTFRYRSLKGFVLKRRTSFRMLVTTVLVLMIFIAAPQVVSFSLILLYVLSGPFEKPITALYRHFRPYPHGALPSDLKEAKDGGSTV